MVLQYFYDCVYSIFYVIGRCFKILKIKCILKRQCSSSTPCNTSRGEFGCEFRNFNDLNISGRHFSYIGISYDIRTILVCIVFFKHQIIIFKFSRGCFECSANIWENRMTFRCQRIQFARHLPLHRGNLENSVWMGRNSGLCSDLFSHSGMNREVSERRAASFPEHTLSRKAGSQGKKWSKGSCLSKGGRANVLASKELERRVRSTSMPVYCRNAPPAYQTDGLK